MTISYNWLKQFIDITESPEELGKILTSTGLEVESVAPFENIKGGLKGIVVGEVLTCKRHPNADKLSITTVDVGNGIHSQIVCGASNVAAGQKVLIALPGARVHPKNGEPFVIKSAKIRGEQSEGMICAEDEVGLGDSHDGIMVLQTSVANGTPAETIFDVESDHVYEIGLTPNRADAASHLGVARDLKAALRRPIKLPSVDAFKTSTTKLTIPVIVENTDACPRYSGLTISGITVSESPAWLKNKLIAIGLTPINNIVDITNYICHELGQPLHAFDADQIKGGKVIVKTLPAGTRFTTLDQKERTLAANDLMICNAAEPMCIAGVFGGAKSGITNQTKSIFLESAYFSPNFVRRTSMHHQLKTDASFRFERGTDPNITVYALKRAAMLILELAGGEISSEVIDVYGSPIGNREIVVKDRNIQRLIGKQIPREEFFGILKNLDIEIKSTQANEFTVSVPPYRVDVMQEADIIEEILRIYGFNNIELSSSARTDFFADFPTKSFDKFKKSIGELLVANGYYEIWTNSLTNAAYQQKQQLTFEGETIEILNKLSEEQGVMRQTMLFTGLEVCSYNINRKQKDLKLFEFGKVYFRSNGKYREEETLAMYLTGNIETENWQRKTSSVTYFDLAQQVNSILSRCGMNGCKQERIDDQLFEYGSQITFAEKPLGKIGKVKSTILKEFGIRQELFYVELSSSLLFNAASPKLVIREVPKFPEVKRDLSLVIDSPVRFEEIEKLVMETEKTLIKEIVAFDVYEGDKIPKGKKAYALSFTLLDENKTLTDQEIEKTMERLMNAFEKKLGAVIRK